jgi:hypothetical protein
MKSVNKGSNLPHTNDQSLSKVSLKSNCRTRLILDSVKEFCKENLLETAFDHAYKAVLYSEEKGKQAFLARFELAVLSLHLQQQSCAKRSEEDAQLADYVSRNIKTKRVEIPEALKLVGHSLFAVDLSRKGFSSSNINKALRHVVLAERYSESFFGDMEIAHICRASNVLSDAANKVFEAKLGITQRKAWKLFSEGDALGAFMTVEAGLQACSLVNRLDPVACEFIVKQQDALRLLGMFFAHQAGDRATLQKISRYDLKKIREPSVRAACKLIKWSALTQDARSQLMQPPTADIVRVIKYFITSASAPVLLVGVTALHTLAVNYARRGQFKEAQVVLTGVITALGWEELRDRYQSHTKDLLASSHYTRAQANYFQRNLRQSHRDLCANLNLLSDKHPMRAPTEFADAFLRHYTAIQQYWLKVLKSDAGAPIEFLREYAEGSRHLPSFEQGLHLDKPQPWSAYADQAKQSYGDARKHARNPNLKKDASEGLRALAEFKLPPKKSPFGPI